MRTSSVLMVELPGIRTVRFSPHAKKKTTKVDKNVHCVSMSKGRSVEIRSRIDIKYNFKENITTYWSGGGCEVFNDRPSEYQDSN